MSVLSRMEASTGENGSPSRKGAEKAAGVTEEPQGSSPQSKSRTDGAENWDGTRAAPQPGAVGALGNWPGAARSHGPGGRPTVCRKSRAAATARGSLPPRPLTQPQTVWLST